MKIKINKREFLKWKFGGKDDIEALWETLMSGLSETEPKIEINLDDIYSDTGYIPTNLIKNSGILTESERENGEIVPIDYEVEWE
jgi:hypothetical protein